MINGQRVKFERYGDTPLSLDARHTADVLIKEHAPRKFRVIKNRSGVLPIASFPSIKAALQAIGLIA